MRILYLKTSPRGDTSLSQRVANHLLDGLRTARPTASIRVRDLARQPLGHIDEHFTAALGLPEEQRSDAQQARIAQSDAAVDELLAADIVVIAVAMINFAIPSTLKAWLDHVARAGKTFRYDESGTPHGLATGKRVILVQAKGGVYADEPARSIDFVSPYLQHMLSFMGMTGIETINVEGTIFDEEAAQKAVAAGIARGRELVRVLANAA